MSVFGQNDYKIRNKTHVCLIEEKTLYIVGWGETTIEWSFNIVTMERKSISNVKTTYIFLVTTYLTLDSVANDANTLLGASNWKAASLDRIKWQ